MRAEAKRAKIRVMEIFKVTRWMVSRIFVSSFSFHLFLPRGAQVMLVLASGLLTKWGNAVVTVLWKT